MGDKRSGKTTRITTLAEAQGHLRGLAEMPEPWDKDKHFEACVPYKLETPLPDHPAFTALVDDIYCEAGIDRLIQIKSARAIASARSRRKIELASLLWHLYLVFRNVFVSSDASLSRIGMTPSYVEGNGVPEYVEFTVFPYVRISLNKNDYRVEDRSNPYKISDNIIKVLKALKDTNFIEVQPGYYLNQVGAGKQTRVRPTTELDLRLRELPELNPAATQKPAPSSFREPVKSSGTQSSKKIVWKEVTCSPWAPELRAADSLVARYNDFLETQRVELVGARSGVLFISVDETEFVLVRETNKYIQNVFHIEQDGDVTFGRMYGGFWQSMPARHRALIRIKGEPVVILDFKAMILNIVASHSGVQLQGDPYDIDLGLGKLHKDVQRSLIKAIVIIGINSKSRTEAVNAVRSAERESFSKAFGRTLTDRDVKAAIQKLRSVYPFLDKYLFKKLGKRIFAVDADIARGVLRRFLDAKKVVLPIHDGFVAAQSDRAFLKHAMESSWKDEFPTVIGIEEE